MIVAVWQTFLKVTVNPWRLQVQNVEEGIVAVRWGNSHKSCIVHYRFMLVLQFRSPVLVFYVLTQIDRVSTGTWHRLIFQYNIIPLINRLQSIIKWFFFSACWQYHAYTNKTSHSIYIQWFKHITVYPASRIPNRSSHNNIAFLRMIEICKCVPLCAASATLQYHTGYNSNEVSIKT